MTFAVREPGDLPDLAGPARLPVRPLRYSDARALLARAITGRQERECGSWT